MAPTTPSPGASSVLHGQRPPFQIFPPQHLLPPWMQLYPWPLFMSYQGFYVHFDPSLNWVFLNQWSQAKMQYLMIRANVLSPFASHGSVSVPDIPMFILYRDRNGVEKVRLYIVNPHDSMLSNFDCSALWVEVHPFAEC